MPRKTPASKVELTPAQKKIRREQRRLDRQRKPKKVNLDPDFDWSKTNLGQKYRTDPRLYVYRCSCKCERASENPPNSICGEGSYHQFRDEKGKLRWMMSFKKRSHRDEMLRDGKAHIGRKVRKEPNRPVS